MFTTLTGDRLPEFIKKWGSLIGDMFQVVIEHENEDFFVFFTRSGNSGTIRLRLRSVVYGLECTSSNNMAQHSLPRV